MSALDALSKEERFAAMVRCVFSCAGWSIRYALSSVGVTVGFRKICMTPTGLVVVGHGVAGVAAENKAFAVRFESSASY